MFNVQYRIKQGNGAEEFLFRTRDPMGAVVQTAESAMREVVGRKKMDSVLFESKQEIAEEVKKLMQEMLDRYHSGIQVLSVAIQNAQPPEQVQPLSMMPLRRSGRETPGLMKERLTPTMLCLRPAVWQNDFVRRLKLTSLVLSLKPKVTQTASISSTHSIGKLRR